ncbi:MAG: M56 family metallopeptidase [Oscillospiraceae bacterium]|nr:M56 family metallopeptidase [Oscillospiraceae bacterium]
MMNEWIISSSVLIAAVLLGRLLLRGRISLRLQYALWGIVLLRLLVPVQFFTSDFGTGSMAREVDISTPVRQAYASANEDRYEAVYNEAYRQLEAHYAANSWSIAPDTIEKEAYTMAQEAQKLDLNQLLQRIWLGGMALMTAVIVACNVHLACQLRKRRWKLDVPASLLPVYVTEAVPTPCVFGFFRPAIYLTPDAAKGSQIRAHVLEHELTHYRHGDHIWSVLRSLCLVLHWYNPLVWLAAKVSRADAELACDEGALARLGESQRGDYGRTLIGLTCSAPFSELLLTATTMTGSAGSIRERIKLLMKRPRNTILTVTAVILLVTLTVGCTFSAAPQTTPPATEPSGPSVPEGSLPEATVPGVDNDMAYTDQDLPIPDDFTVTTLTYALPMEQAMADYADQNPRELTEQELKEFRAAFATTDENGNVNPAACFLYPYYDDITEMDGGEFLAYFPTDQEGTKEEFALLKAKYPDFFADWTWETMPIPIHRYDAKAIEAVVSRFGNIHWPELDEGVHYLEETGCYYNYTSDFGLGGFYAREGFVFDGGAVVYSDFSALYFAETAGYYSLRAHYPLIASPELINEAGLLVYPDTEWGMTEAELLDALDIQEYALLSGSRGFLLPDTEFFGYPATISFYFSHYRGEDEWGLSNVYVDFQDEEAANAVYPFLYEQLGKSDFATSGVAFTAWWSDAKLADMISPEAYAIYQEMTEEYPAHGGAASTISWYGGSYPAEPRNSVRFTSHLHLARQIEAAITPDNAPEEAVQDVLDAFFQAHQENSYLDTNQDYDTLTVRSADPKRTVTFEGKTVPLSDFFGNIEYLHDKETYWKHVRQDQGISRTNFSTSCQISEIEFDGDTAYALVNSGVTFTYTDAPNGAPSGMGSEYEVLLIRVDGRWLIADVLARNDWFDAENKNNPDFDVEKLISN